MRIHKYVVFGFGAAFGVAIAATTAIIAADSSAPIKFKAGDVISADQLNDQFGKIKTVLEGFSSSDDLLGAWQCTTNILVGLGYDPCTSTATPSPGGLLSTATQTITFSKSGSTYSWASTFAPGTCGTGAAVTSAQYELLGGNKLVSVGAQYKSINNVFRTSPTTFTWDINAGISGGGTTTYVTCVKANLPPAIPSALSSAFASGTVTLTWTANSTDQTGYKVAKKTTLTGAYSDVGTPTATTYSEALTTGTYWYRVRSTNANGDSLGSNEVVVTVP